MQEVANDFICAKEQRCIILSYFPPLHTHIHSSQPYHSNFCNYTPGLTDNDVPVNYMRCSGII